MPTLKPSKYAEEHIAPAVIGKFGEALADCFSMSDSHAKNLYQSSSIPLSSAENQIRRKLNSHQPWDSLTIAHLRVIHAVHSDSNSSNFLAVFDAQKSLVSAYNDWFRTDNTAWSLPVLYVIYRDLRAFATRADEALLLQGEKAAKLAEAARLIQVGFGLCCSDRTSAGDTKKLGVLYMASLLFKIYFKLKSTALCKNVIRGVENAGLLDGFQVPIAHRVTYRYYMGVLSFLQEDYEKAEEHLYFAFNNCYRNKRRNRDLIMNYLVPLRLLKGKRPIPALLRQFSQLSDLYQPFITAVRLGNIELFDRHLSQVEKQLMKRGTYLIVERCRDVCLCNFVKLVHRLKAPAHQIPLDSFRKIAYEVEDEPEEEDGNSKLEEVECLLANLIAQDRVRGYIHHQAKMLVLSKIDAFPAQTVIRGY
ncbi:COP9 signalosome (CSN) subunit [Puccinia graminis f. sp. tritici]|uniref:COP9 signalosome (CSN) subunit n=1 Tax=Puccinia graminis f. sp. tritici TaxID=56615 RepID=A0A5B0QM90_PUCGR|nr:COP9 signalosome (CSN) subunit [Puccinia graminis f. sp. tritici]KAA1124470.1 COP9 signalosome (CSN) subunit [Puccinia graminis f. sp. tritici]